MSRELNDLIHSITLTLEELNNIKQYLYKYTYYADEVGLETIKRIYQLIKELRANYGELQFRLYER